MAMPMEPTHEVACYAGAQYPERPRSFTWEGERVLVEQVLASSRSPEATRFRVLAAGGRAFELTYRHDLDQWRIVEV